MIRHNTILGNESPMKEEAIEIAWQQWQILYTITRKKVFMSMVSAYANRLPILK